MTLLLLFGMFAGLLPRPGIAAEAPPTVAIASSLRLAWPALEQAWQKELPGLNVRTTFGGSHVLATQIARGAPFDLFLAADAEAVARLSARDGFDREARTYALGRLVLVRKRLARADKAEPMEETAPATAPTNVADADAAAIALADALTTFIDSANQRLAIPNPNHAPYGRAAREALDKAGLWPLPDTRRVSGETAVQALQFALSGAADLAILPRSLSSELPDEEWETLVLSDALHEPLAHTLLVLEQAGEDTLRLADWFLSDPARQLLQQAGFDTP